MKERMKSILFVLALALVFVGAAKVTEAAAADAQEYKINYVEEKIQVSVTGSVYYQVVKNATDKTNMKAANWVPAAMDTDGKFYIDFSALANTKDAYIAYVDKADATTAKDIITVPAKVKSVKVTLNYATEQVTSGGIFDVIAKLDVKGNAKDKSGDFVWPSTTDAKVKGKDLDEVVVLGWKRGANGVWKTATDFRTVDWEMMKASNTTLYLRVEKTNLDAKEFDAFRFSKEAKVKIPKTAKAPTIKIDYKKQTVAIKSGMEFRAVGDTEWIGVAAKVKNSTGTDIYDVEKGLAKAVSSLTLDQLREKITVASGNAVEIEVRTAATDKKFASQMTTVKFKAPQLAPIAASGAASAVLTYTPAVAASGSTKAVAPKLVLDLSKVVDKIDETYEYALVGSDYDPALVKFTKATGNEIDLSSKIKSSLDAKVKYTDKTGNKNATVEYLKAKVIIRKAAVTTKGKEVFASEILEITPVIKK